MRKFLVYTVLPSGAVAYASKRTPDTDEATYTFAKSEAESFSFAIDAQQVANIRSTEFSTYLHPAANMKELPDMKWRVGPCDELP